MLMTNRSALAHFCDGRRMPISKRWGAFAPMSSHRHDRRYIDEEKKSAKWHRREDWYYDLIYCQWASHATSPFRWHSPPSHSEPQQQPSLIDCRHDCYHLYHAGHSLFIVWRPIRAKSCPSVDMSRECDGNEAIFKIWDYHCLQSCSLE